MSKCDLRASHLAMDAMWQRCELAGDVAVERFQELVDRGAIAAGKRVGSQYWIYIAGYAITMMEAELAGMECTNEMTGAEEYEDILAAQEIIARLEG